MVMKMELLTSLRKQPPTARQEPAPVVEQEVTPNPTNTEEEEDIGVSMSENGRQRLKREMRMLKKSNPSLYEKITQFR
jgi:hypothetical protein